MIRELEKYTEKAGNTVDGPLLRTAAERIEAVVTLVNEATRTAEEKYRILALEGQIESPVVNYKFTLGSRFCGKEAS